MKTNIWGSFLFRYFLISALLFSSVGYLGYKLSHSFLEVLRPPRPMHRRGPHNRKLKNGDNLRGPGHRRHFKVLGMSPPAFVTLSFGSSLFLLFIFHHFLTFYLFRRSAKQTREVLIKLKQGDLKARFPEKGEGHLGIISTEVNEMASELEKLVVNLERAEIQRKGILQELVHDVRTPITSLNSMLEVLKYHRLTMSELEVDSFLKSSLSEVKYFEKLVNDLLFISDIAQLETRISLSKLDLGLILEAQLLSYQSGSILITTKIDKTNQIYIDGDNQQILRLLQNGLTNALSFAKQAIVVKLSTKEGFARIEVIDDGPGISKERMRNFGEKLRSREISDDTRISIGLGAVIMKKIASAHGGRVSISNSIAKKKIQGAHLLIEIPLKN